MSLTTKFHSKCIFQIIAIITLTLPVTAQINRQQNDRKLQNYEGYVKQVETYTYHVNGRTDLNLDSIPLNGPIIEHFNKNGNYFKYENHNESTYDELIRYYTYDSLNRLISIEQQSDRPKSYNSSTKIKYLDFKEEHYFNGRTWDSTAHLRRNQIVKFNDSYQEIEEIVCSGIDDIESWTVSKSSYDKDGNQIKKIQYEGPDKIRFTEIWGYNKDGLISEYKKLDKDSSLFQHSVYEYNENNLKFKETIRMRDSLSDATILYSYDYHKNLVQLHRTNTNSNKEIIIKYRLVYDRIGNIVKSEIIRNGKTSGITIRKFTYY